jgi:hypothetical protein
MTSVASAFGRHRSFLIMLAVLACPRPALAQPARYAFAPPGPGITAQMDVQYGTSGTARLAMDLYKPAGPIGAGAPALIFFNRASGKDRSDGMNGFYAQWARAAASKGLIGILPDLRDGTEAADFRMLIAYLEERGREHGIAAIGSMRRRATCRPRFRCSRIPR